MTVANPSLIYAETADIETSSADYARRFSGEVGEWFLTIQEQATLSMLADYPGAEILAPRKVIILNDVSLLKDRGSQEKENLKAALGINGPMLMYVGNLQTYQGIDLLIESFAVALKQVPNLDLAIIGLTFRTKNSGLF